MTKRCAFIKEDGSQCGAFAMSGGDLCFTHSPTTAGERARARSLGGANKAGAQHKATVIEADAIRINADLLARIEELEARAARLENRPAQGSKVRPVALIEPEEEVNLGEQPAAKKAKGWQG